MIIDHPTEGIILAGGVGSRLFPLTKKIPKPLIPVGNYALLDWNIYMMSKAGFRTIIIAVNYLGNLIRAHVEEISSQMFPNINILIPEVNPKNTADAVRQVANHLNEDQFFVTMGDIVTDINLHKMYQFHVKKDALGTILLRKTDTPRQYGIVFLGQNDQIKLFLEKPKPENVTNTIKQYRTQNEYFFHNNLANTGVYCFKHQILELLDTHDYLMDFGQEVFPFILKSNEKVGNLYGFRCSSNYYWIDCGNLDQLIQANLDVFTQKIEFPIDSIRREIYDQA